MQKKQLFAGVLVTFSALAVLSGCQQAPAQPQNPADDVIKTGLANLANLTSYSYDLAMNADVNDPAGKSGKFDVKLAGALDIKDGADPKFTAKFDGTASESAGMGGSGSFDLSFNKEAVYFNVAKLSLTGGEAMPKEVTDMFGKWWKVTLPAGAVNEITASIPQGSQQKLTPEQQQVKQAFEDSHVLSNPTFVRTEDVMGESSYQYTVTVDKKNIIAFMKKVSELQGTTVSETEIADAQKNLDKVDLKADVWVGSTSMVLNKIKLDIKLISTAATDPSGTISATVMLGNMNKPVTLNVPKDATEFPVEQFLGPLMMGSGATGTEQMGLDAGSMDASSMMDSGYGLDTSTMMDTNVDAATPVSSGTQQ